MRQRFLAGAVWALMAGGGLGAAVIRGTVVEQQTGKFLARAVVAVEPVAGTPGGPVSMRTNISGTFEFSALAAGSYVLKVSRLGFMPVEYGQKRWNSAGTPLAVDDSAPAFLTIRLPRWAAISGTVVDENDIGLPEHEVVAYRNSRPPQVAAHVKSDERGVYRISGLEPGTYVVRTAGATYEEGDFLPTFGKESIALENARMVEVDLDQQANNIDVRPAPGKLFSVSGAVIPDPPGTPTKVTLATDIGRQTVTTPDVFQFQGLSPGAYEIYAEAPANNDPNVKLQGAYVASTLRADAGGLSLTLSTRSNVTIEVIGGPARAQDSGQNSAQARKRTPASSGGASSGGKGSGSGAAADAGGKGGQQKAADQTTGQVQLQARRKDLAGEDDPVILKLVNGRAPLPPGRWEVRLLPPAGYYVARFTGSRTYRGSRSRPDGWNEIVANGYGGTTRFELSSGGGSLTGTVKDGMGMAVAAPVYLEAWDPDSRQRMAELRVTRTDAQGGYSFKDLAPGAYRVLATFEYRNPDSAAFDAANATSLQAEAHGDLQRDLGLYVIR